MKTAELPQDAAVPNPGEELSGLVASVLVSHPTDRPHR
jgi:hypothetical protein